MNKKTLVIVLIILGSIALIVGGYFAYFFITGKLTGKNQSSSSITRGTVDPDFSVETYQADKVFSGTTLLPDNHNPQNPRVIEVNMLGEIIWEYKLPEELKQYNNPGFDTELLPNKNILMLLPGKGVYEIDRSKNVVWSYFDKKVSHDADRLENGNTLVVFGNNDKKDEAQVKEINSKGEIVWSWYAKEYFNKAPYKDISEGGWTHTNAAVRMANGNTLVSLRNFNLLAEIDPQGEVVKTYGEGILQHPHDPEVLDNSNILVANHGNPQKAIEIDSKTGKIIWEFTMDKRKSWPVKDADRLPNGNTLITGSTAIVEVTSKGEIVWNFIINNANFSKEDSSGRGFYKAQRIPE